MIQRAYISREIFVDNVTYESVCNYVDHVLTHRWDKKPRLIFAQNALKVITVRRRPDLQDILRSADVLIPDGMGIILAARISGVKLLERVTGVDLVWKLVSLSVKKGYSIYFLGGEPGVAELAANNLKKEYPALKIAGTANGYFSEKDEEIVIEKINNAEPDILIVCMGSPKQELFLFRNKEKINVPICVGGGGSLDIYAGNVKRAPQIVQQMGFEWMYRLIKDPKRFRKYAIGYTEYLILLIKDLLLKKVWQ